MLHFMGHKESGRTQRWNNNKQVISGPTDKAKMEGVSYAKIPRQLLFSVVLFHYSC